MYICLECGKSFEKPLKWYQQHLYDDGDGEMFSVSPCCLSDYTEAEECELCKSETLDSEHVCGRCRAATIKQFAYFLMNEFTSKEISVLDEYIDGKSLSDVIDEQRPETDGGAT